MIAVKRLQSVLWVLLVTCGALSAYLVSLRVGAERNDLAKVRAQIVATHSDIRYLETEFAARSSLRQLERWNAEDFRYTTPTATQYLDGERSLASLDGVEPNGPAYVAPPVMMAMVRGPADEPSAAVAESAPASPAPEQIRGDMTIIHTARAAEPPAKAASADAGRGKDREVAGAALAARKAERMAMLDSKLLDDRTLGDLTSRAAREKRKDTR